jgi:hypothetical protein
MSTGYKIELNWEMVDEIVVGMLRSTRESWKRDMEKPSHVFVHDPEEDCVEIQKHIDAVETLLKWYATPEQLREMGLKDD